jgi:myo-inositol-1(or 4)-monophosphatase
VAISVLDFSVGFETALSCRGRLTISPTRQFLASSNPSQSSPNSATATTDSISTGKEWMTELALSDLKCLAQTAEAAARAAGRIILQAQQEKAKSLLSSSRHTTTCNVQDSSYLSSSSTEIKASFKDIVTVHDKNAQTVVEEIIRKVYPDHSFLGEEDVDPGAAASEQALLDVLSDIDSGYFLWICDPIDGTANFASGLPLCGVTVSLLYKGTAIVGVIYDPFADEVFTAIKGHGATVNGEPLSVAKDITDIKDAIINAGCPADPNAFAASMRGIAALNSEARGLRMIACSALTTAWIAAGRLTAHFGYDLSSWDLVAGALLIQEAGGLVTDLDGSPYRIETRNMLCSNGLVHEPILKVLTEADAVSFQRS